jgi:hypothetical protein
MAEAKNEFDHVAFMRDPYLWPNLVLPVKRSAGGGFPALGVMFGDGPNVVKRSMFELKEPIKEDEVLHYPTFEAIYESGWRVD